MITRILSFFAFSLAIQVNAQSLVLIDPVTTVTGTLAELGTTGELVADWDVQNISDNTLSVRCYRSVIEQVAGSENYFCWGVCFTSATNISPVQAAQIMDAGQINNTFYAHYRANGNAGQTTVKYCFFDNANPSDEACHTVTYCVDMDECVVSVEENALAGAELGVYPSVLSGIGKFSYSLPAAYRAAQMEIFNTAGQLIESIQLNNNNGIVILDGQDFAPGAYMVRVSANGTILGNTRFAVSH
jgi:hypothetical protein